MAKIGYARTSSTGQSLHLQLQKLTSFGCVEPEGSIFVEDQYIVDIDERPALTACFDTLKTNDLLVITKLDRLSRSTDKFTQLLSKLEQRGASLLVIDQNIDTRTWAGKWRLKYQLLSRYT